MVPVSQLPPFLQPIGGSTSESYHDAVFQHGIFGPAHSLWWPAECVETVLLFIPGNPGLLEFYIPFLSAIHQKVTSSKLAILAHSYIGHTPGINTPRSPSSCDLTVQVQAAIEVFGAIHTTFGHNTRIVIVGHSVGAWVALQVLKAKPDSVSSVFLLFPTIANIAATSHGRSLHWLFRSPLPRIISSMSFLTRLLPTILLSKIFRSWPTPQILVLRKLLCSPASIYECLSMAHDEMSTIRELDAELLNKHIHRIWVYFAEVDDWVGDQKNIIIKEFGKGPESIRIVHGSQDIPHAFCINHGEQLAMQCCEWLWLSVS